MRAKICPDSARPSPLQVVHTLIATYDMDGDGQLSFDEFKVMLSASIAATADEGALPV